MNIKKLLIDHFKEETLAREEAERAAKVAKEAEEKNNTLKLKIEGALNDTPHKGLDLKHWQVLEEIKPVSTTPIEAKFIPPREPAKPGMWDKIFSGPQSTVSYKVAYSLIEDSNPKDNYVIMMTCTLFEGIHGVTSMEHLETDALALIDWAIELSLKQHDRVPDPTKADLDTVAPESGLLLVTASNQQLVGQIRGGAVKIKI